jgi:predicted metal-dependent RNase
LTDEAAYLITPDQYILGRWKNFTQKKAIDLINLYLSGVVYDNTTLQKTEQEIIDEQVAEKLMRLAN